MSIRYYDKALIDKISGWVKQGAMQVLGPDESGKLFAINADLKNDKPLELPLIALSRDKDVEILYTNKKPMSFDGKMTDCSADYTYQLNAIPIKISYQLDIYAKKQEQADEYLRSLLFNLINHPKAKIEIPYNNSHRTHNFSIDVESTISDNSDIPQRIFSGQFVRWTIGLSINDAYLFSVPKYDTISATIDDVVVETTDNDN